MPRNRPPLKSEWWPFMITSSSSQDVHTGNGGRSSKSRREHNVKHVYGYVYVMNTFVMKLKRPENEGYACIKDLATVLLPQQGYDELGVGRTK